MALDREALDRFFATAEDVLTDWNPPRDSMIAVAPSPEVESDPPLPELADSFHRQSRRGLPSVLDGITVGAEGSVAGRWPRTSVLRLSDWLERAGVGELPTLDRAILEVGDTVTLVDGNLGQTHRFRVEGRLADGSVVGSSSTLATVVTVVMHSPSVADGDVVQPQGSIEIDGSGWVLPSEWMYLNGWYELGEEATDE